MQIIEKDAKIFEAGSFPDKGIEVTESDLERMVANHKPVPIKVEHTDSPLNLGSLVCIWRKGRELFGRLAFTHPAWELVKASGARKLSVGMRKDKSGISEVSLVRNPRIADAAVFSFGGLTFFNDGDNVSVEVDFTFERGDEVMNTGGGAPGGVSAEMQKLLDAAKEEGRLSGKAEAIAGFNANESSAAVKLAELERKNAEKDADAKISALKAEGKLTPAAEKFARAILIDGNAEVTFADGAHMPASQAFLNFLANQPNVVEIPGSVLGNRGTEFSADAQKVLDQLGVTAEQAAEVMSK